MNQPLGAALAADGVHFSVYSSAAEKIELCLFDPNGAEARRVPLARGDDGIWQVFVPGLNAGAEYGYRAHGEFAPERGVFFNPGQVLLDPYAKMLTGFHGIVVDNSFAWENDVLPRIPYAKTVVYEAHVRGLTMKFPGLPEAVRGSYQALGHEKVVAHLQKLGITTVELLPVHVKCDDQFLVDRGLSNYWGYSTVNFFAPETRYACSANAIHEFKTMVQALHRAGIEVILDVVYNHTAEMGANGPTFSLRGFDNKAYYLWDEKSGFIDHTGCGNTLNVAHPMTRRLVLDSLRYWAEEMHVDGFRFDLAPALFREAPHDAPQMQGEFARAIAADPVLSQLKLIAEPWDLGPHGYARDAFRHPWVVWNDRFRDQCRRFWRGDDAAHALTHEMQAANAINFITCHDGFTLRDLVSYREKHNEANREENRDGASENFSDNYGCEGDSRDAAIEDLRLRQRKNMLATLIFSRPPPMLLSGDEIGHTQKGNNNAYCQDNDIAHLAWPEPRAAKSFESSVLFSAERRRDDLVDFISACLELRRALNVSDADYEALAAESPDAAGIVVRHRDKSRILVMLMNASANTSTVFRLPEQPGFFVEKLNTGRPAGQEPVSGIFIVLPRSFVILQSGG